MIRVTIQIYDDKSGIERNKTVEITPTSRRKSLLTQRIGHFVHEELEVSLDMADPGITWMWFDNTAETTDTDYLDPTSNYIDIGRDVSGSFKPMLRILPGEPQAFRLHPDMVDEYGVIRIYAKAGIRDAYLEHLIIEA